MLSCELTACMHTRRWQTALVLKVRPRGRGIVASRAASVGWLTLVQSHWPSSDNRKLQWRDKKAGILGLTTFAGTRGIVLGDINVPKRDTLEDLLSHAEYQGQWRYKGNNDKGPDWVLYHQCFQQAPHNFPFQKYFSDAHYPVCFVVSDTTGLESSQAADEVTGVALRAVAGASQPTPPLGAPNNKARPQAAIALHSTSCDKQFSSIPAERHVISFASSISEVSLHLVSIAFLCCRSSSIPPAFQQYSSRISA